MAKQFTDEREKKFYRAWGDMKHRCNTPTAKAYPKYGGRGIKKYVRTGMLMTTLKEICGIVTLNTWNNMEQDKQH